MKKYLAIFLFVTVFFLGRLMAAIYGGAEEEIFFNTDRTQTSSSLDSDIRLRSMGGLNVAVEDESNKIGIFKTLGSPAGLPLDYETPKAELSIFFEKGSLDDNTTHDDSFTGETYETQQTQFDGMGVVPFETPQAGKGAFAVAFSATPGEKDYSQEWLDSTIADSYEDEPKQRAFFAGYGHQWGKFLGGISYTTADEDEEDIEFFVGSTQNRAVDETKTKAVKPSLGYIFQPDQNQKLIVTFYPRILNYENTVKAIAPSLPLDVEAVTDGDGVYYVGGLTYSFLEIFKGTLFVQKGELDGDITTTTSGSVTKEDWELDHTSFGLRGILRPETWPVSFGLSYKRAQDDGDLFNSSNVKTSGAESTESILKLGVTGHFPEEKGLAGLEVHVIDEEDEDTVLTTDPSSNEERKGYQFSLGGEYRVLDPLWVRGGYRIRNVSEDPKGDASELDTTTNEINLGLEYEFEDLGSVSLAYAYTQIENDGNQSATEALQKDEEEFKGHSLMLVGKYRFGKRQED
ncbi:hypothetical protein BVX98_01215 [bacterium F11]|nr:hypothetical protein BVX98_01215 [bacterium F11]